MKDITVENVLEAADPVLLKKNKKGVTTLLSQHENSAEKRTGGS